MPEYVTTTAQIIRFCVDMEAALASLYDAAAVRFPMQADTFRTLARDCDKTSGLVIRAYQETVTDALETGFTFSGIDLDQYIIDNRITGDIALDDARHLAIVAETKAIALYEDIAVHAASLLATIPRVFKRAARNHTQHHDILTES